MWLPTLCMSVCYLPPPPIHVVLKTMCLHLPCSSHRSVYIGHLLLSTIDIKFYKTTFHGPKNMFMYVFSFLYTTFFSESAVDVEHYIHDKSIRRRLILLSLSNSKFGMSVCPGLASILLRNVHTTSLFQFLCVYVCSSMYLCLSQGGCKANERLFFVCALAIECAVHVHTHIPG